MPKAIKKKTTKKNVGTETEVKDKLSDLKNKLRLRQKSVAIYGIITVSLIIAVGAMLFFNRISKGKSQQLEYEAYRVYYNAYQNQALTKQEQFQKALDLFKQAYGKKKSPSLLLYIASSYYELDKYDDALASLNEFIKNYDSEKDLLPLAYQKMASVQLKKGNKDEALKTLDKIYKSSSDIYKDIALIESGRILEKDGKIMEAAAKYKELTEKFPESPFFEEAKARLGEKKQN